jgi:hypothetical protein
MKRKDQIEKKLEWVQKAINTCKEKKIDDALKHWGGYEAALLWVLDLDIG